MSHDIFGAITFLF